MNNLLDTFLNLTVFAFIGLLVWLYFRPLPSDEDNQRDTENTSRTNEDLVRGRESENA
ncbi:MAG: hypothetical protein HOB56_05575 [Proteobacteria bacterium]|jgi:hypothetical protein|nr:hypothetical protein [Pseudomonadota bacterium]MBT6657233.1 hypothetical protein [Pseudomonadota bacterium]MBT6931299.1 hypothetical protein [Pseudomonadota bacterium]MBT7813706.1 hypothetical protein [Pseudomonadota bacterium]